MTIGRTGVRPLAAFPSAAWDTAAGAASSPPALLGSSAAGRACGDEAAWGTAAGAASLPQSAMELETMSAICMGRRLTKTGSGSSRRLNAPLGPERREFGLERRVFGLQRPACSLFR